MNETHKQYLKKLIWIFFVIGSQLVFFLLVLPRKKILSLTSTSYIAATVIYSVVSKVIN